VDLHAVPESPGPGSALTRHRANGWSSAP
jgi:hypothetical protein